MMRKEIDFLNYKWANRTKANSVTGKLRIESDCTMVVNLYIKVKPQTVNHHLFLRPFISYLSSF